MTAWERDQSFGFFGYTPATKTHPEQFLHRAVVDLDLALAESADVTSRYFLSRSFPYAPAFSGGVLDCWPRWAAEGFAICQDEERAVDEFLRSKR